MKSANTRKCPYCNQVKVWVWSGERLRDGSKVYVDEHEHRWSGRRCPSCERVRVTRALRCDRFSKASIIHELESSGYVVRSSSLPILAEKDGQTVRVGLRRASTRSGSLEWEDEKAQGPEEVDMVAVLVESVRLVAPHQLPVASKADSRSTDESKSSGASQSSDEHAAQVAQGESSAVTSQQVAAERKASERLAGLISSSSGEH